MKKLNQKGMSTIEILVCFVLVSIITISMYSMVTAYKEKQQIESYKETVTTYKNLLTKDIQDDLIMVGLSSVTINDRLSITFQFLNGEEKTLRLEQGLNGDVDAIVYGEMSYPLPNLGYSTLEDGSKKYDFQIQWNQDPFFEINNGVCIIYIGFTHPDLGDRYAISIVCPVQFF